MTVANSSDETDFYGKLLIPKLANPKLKIMISVHGIIQIYYNLLPINNV